jgi:DNA-binding MarR family transcriptional regulator
MEITYPQYLVLTTLYEKGPLTISEIAESLFLNSSTITPLVKRLQGADLISRTRNAKNERQVIVELTEKGTHLQRDAQCLGTTLAARSGMSTDQLMTLNAQLSQLKETISKLEPPTGE